jgi:hypothetical protein
MHEALAAALAHWQEQGIPENREHGLRRLRIES